MIELKLAACAVQCPLYKHEEALSGSTLSG